MAEITIRTLAAKLDCIDEKLNSFKVLFRIKLAEDHNHKTDELLSDTIFRFSLSNTSIYPAMRDHLPVSLHNNFPLSLRPHMDLHSLIPDSARSSCPYPLFVTLNYIIKYS